MPLKNKPVVFVTCAGGITGISVLKSLLATDAIILTGDSDPLSSCRHFDCMFFVLPKISSSHFLDKILEICINNNVNLIIPTHDLELLFFSKHEKTFSGHNIKLLLAPYSTLEICLDKIKFFNYLSEHNIPTPHTYDARDINSVSGNAHHPYIIKPKHGTGSKYTFIVKNYNNIRSFLDEIPDNTEMIIQHYIEGTEFTVDCLFTNDSNPIFTLIRERLSVKAGVSYKSKLSFQEDIQSMTVKLARMLHLKGPANIQFIKAGDNLHCIEINPRFSGGLSFSTGFGVNSPQLLLEYLFNNKSDRLDVNYDNHKIGIRYWSEGYIPPNSTNEIGCS